MIFRKLGRICFASRVTSGPGQLPRPGPIQVSGQSEEEQHGDEERQSRPKSIGLRKVFLRCIPVSHVSNPGMAISEMSDAISPMTVLPIAATAEPSRQPNPSSDQDNGAEQERSRDGDGFGEEAERVDVRVLDRGSYT